MSASRLLLNYTHQTQLNQKKVIINNKYHLCTAHNEKSEKINKTKYYSTSNNTYILHKYKYIPIILSNGCPPQSTHYSLPFLDIFYKYCHLPLLP